MNTNQTPDFVLYGYVLSDGVFVTSASAKLHAKKRRLTACEIYTLRPANAIFAVLQGDNVWGITNLTDDAVLTMLDPYDLASIASVEFGEIKQFTTPAAAILAAVFEISRTH